MQLPYINQQSQGNNVQTPRVPSGQQYAQSGTSPLPQRPMQNMAPDNGQHGGAQRYMNPMSGAMNASNQRQANPYMQKGNTYPGQSQPLPPIRGELTPMTMTDSQQQEMQQSNNMYRQALKQRLMNQKYNPMGYMAPPAPPQQPMPPMMGQGPNSQYGG